MGNRALYYDLLGRFCEGQGDTACKISEALTKGDLPLAERLAHTLKGVAGTIGAMGVSEAAATVEKAIHNHSLDGIDASIETLGERVEKAITETRLVVDRERIQAAAIAPAQGNKSPRSLEAIKVELLSFANKNDGELVDLFGLVRDELLATCDHELVREIERAVSGFDFATVAEKVRQLDRVG